VGFSPAGFKFAMKIKIQTRYSSQDLIAGDLREVKTFFKN